MRNRETVLTYKEENGFFIQVKCKVIMFHRLLGNYTEFLLLTADWQKAKQNPTPNPNTIKKNKSNIIYILFTLVWFFF